MIFDTHCHAYWKDLENIRKDVLLRMASENVLRSVQVGTDWETNQKALSLARNWGSDTWCSVALHPSSSQHRAADTAVNWVVRLEEFIEQNRDKIVAVGETGLDYFHLKKADRAGQMRSQRAFFAAHAALAQKMDLPLIIHTRDAAADTLDLIMECGIRRAVVHCFSEDVAFARALMDWSEEIYFSFSGILTYKNASRAQETARALPLGRIMVETDAPFLVPEAAKSRFRINEPCCTRHVLDFLKKMRTESAEEVEQTIWDNSNRFFGIA